MDTKVIESSKTWKRAFNVSANLLLMAAVGWCVYDWWWRDGLSGSFVLFALASLVLVHVLCSIDGVKGVYYLRATYLAFVLGALVFFLNIMPKDSLVIAIGELSGSVSLIEPIITFVIFIVSVSVQISLLGSRRREKDFSYVAFACLGVIGLLLPRMIDSYALVWGCSQKACEEGGSKFADLVPLYNVAFSFAATLGVLALLSCFALPLVNKLPKFSDVS